MIGYIVFVVGFLILWLGIKFLAVPVGSVDEPSWFRSALWAIIIWFISYVVSFGLMSAYSSTLGGG